jgi:diaminopimelate epimerase
MTTQIPFRKFHGLGNDFAIIDWRGQAPRDWSRTAITLCDRHTGIGADGFLVIESTPDADARMRIVNSDGTEAQMCGNGIRCVAKVLSEERGQKDTQLTIATAGGLRTIKTTGTGGQFRAAVSMGRPETTASRIPANFGAHLTSSEILDHPIEDGLRVTCVSMGNPHAVFFFEPDQPLDLASFGPHYETDPRFPARVNVQVARVSSRNQLRLDTWERGAGITQACGTGACATVVAGILTNRLDPAGEVTVQLPGGPLTIFWPNSGAEVIMTGPATEVFRGTFTDPVP